MAKTFTPTKPISQGDLRADRKPAWRFLALSRILFSLFVILQLTCAYLSIKWGLADGSYSAGHSVYLAWQHSEDGQQTTEYLQRAHGHVMNALSWRSDFAPYLEVLGGIELDMADDADYTEEQVRTILEDAWEIYGTVVEMLPASPVGWSMLGWTAYQINPDDKNACTFLSQAAQRGPYYGFTRNISEASVNCVAKIPVPQ